LLVFSLLACSPKPLLLLLSQPLLLPPLLQLPLLQPLLQPLLPLLLPLLLPSQPQKWKKRKTRKPT
jgi:hypothetical protein